MAKTKPTRRGGAGRKARQARPKDSKKSSRKTTAARRARPTRRAQKPASKRRQPRASASKAATARKATAKATKVGARKTSARTPVRRAAKPRTSLPKARMSPTKPRPVVAKAKTVAKARTAKPSITPARTIAAPVKAIAPRRRPPTLDRERRRVSEPELVPSPPSSLDLDRSASAARSGRAELNHKLHEHTSTGPALTAGDVDADWESADSVGDEAPGGDNPTPDQDVVDEIGKALGVEYDDDEELRAGDKIGERDRKRWELDPASSDDFDERDE